MVDSEAVRQARETMQDAFDNDPDFRRSYVANVACLIMDFDPSYQLCKDDRDELASCILDKIFN